jgi:hypothetical protein
MGFMFVLGLCAACHQLVSFNPHWVPSIRVHGLKEPLCQRCAERWNDLHPEPAQPIHPDAYQPEEV